VENSPLEFAILFADAVVKAEADADADDA